jgi:hypothetical protein
VNNSKILSHLTGREALEARVAHRIAARLNERVEQLPSGVSERLRFAREQALERARVARAAAADTPVPLAAGASAVFGRASGWGLRFASVLPLLALAAGLLLIQHWHDEAQIATAAEIDADLLSDDLPPNAYSDAGFVEFLKTPRE